MRHTRSDRRIDTYMQCRQQRTVAPKVDERCDSRTIQCGPDVLRFHPAVVVGKRRIRGPCNRKAPIAEWTGEKPQPITGLALRAADEAARRRMIRRPAIVAPPGNVRRLPGIDRVGWLQIKFSSDAFCHEPITVANRNPPIRLHHFQVAVQWWRATQRYLCRGAAE